MEFKFRAEDHKSPSYQHPSSSSTMGFPSFLRGGFPISDQMPLPNDATGEDILREFEKQQIRRDIFSGELARRRMLEEEVRRELMVEREMALRVTMGFSHRLNVEESNAFQNSRVLNSLMTMPPFPQLVGPEIRPESGITNKDKLIVLAKPDPDQYGAKRKAVTPPAVECEEQCPLGLMKKPKEERSCALCQISVTCERALNEHLKGKKHKAKESALRKQKIGLDAKADGFSLEGENQTVQNDGSDPNTYNSNEQNRSSGKTKAMKWKRKFKFWCGACNVGSFSRTVMENHKKGRKHIRRTKFCQNDGSDPPTSTISSEATPSTKDVDNANVETELKTADGFPNSVESSSVAESSGDRVVGEEEL